MWFHVKIVLCCWSDALKVRVRKNSIQGCNEVSITRMILLIEFERLQTHSLIISFQNTSSCDYRTCRSIHTHCLSWEHPTQSGEARRGITTISSSLIKQLFSWYTRHYRSLKLVIYEEKYVSEWYFRLINKEQ